MHLAVWWHGARDLRLRDAPEVAAPRPGEAVVQVAWCGICGTDLTEWQDGPVIIRSTPHPLTGESPPMVLGHEFSGVVQAVDDGVAVPVGTRVAVDPCWRCGTCFWCQRGDYHICALGGAVGLASHGALAPLVRVPAVGLIPLPEGLDLRRAALAEPLAVALHAVQRGGVGLGSRVLICGFGPIGAAVLLAARASGAALIAVSEPAAARRARATEFGADLVLDPTADDVRRTLFTATGRVGPDVALECSGSAAGLDTALTSVRRGGTAVMVGIGHSPVAVAPRQVVPFERSLIGSIGYRHDLERAVALLAAGRIDGEKLITAQATIDDALEGAFGRLARGEGDLKVLVRVGVDQ